MCPARVEALFDTLIAASDSVACCCSNGTGYHQQSSSYRSLQEASSLAATAASVASMVASSGAQDEPDARAEPAAHPAFARGDWDAIALRPGYPFTWSFLHADLLLIHACVLDD